MQSEQPYTGDNRYWLHLLPCADVVDVHLRPPQPLLLWNPMVPIEMDLFHAYLYIFMSWIPTRSGSWESLPEELVCIDKSGAAEAERIFRALADLFSSAPEVISVPIPKMVYASGSRGVPSVTHITYPRHDLHIRFQELARFSSVLAAGTHVIFCSYWLERGE